MTTEKNDGTIPLMAPAVIAIAPDSSLVDASAYISIEECPIDFPAITFSTTTRSEDNIFLMSSDLVGRSSKSGVSLHEDIAKIMKGDFEMSVQVTQKENDATTIELVISPEAPFATVVCLIQPSTDQESDNVAPVEIIGTFVQDDTGTLLENPVAYRVVHWLLRQHLSLVKDVVPVEPLMDHLYGYYADVGLWKDQYAIAALQARRILLQNSATANKKVDSQDGYIVASAMTGLGGILEAAQDYSFCAPSLHKCSPLL